MAVLWQNPVNKVGGTNRGKRWDKEFLYVRRAIKNHVCSECGLKIEVGDVYLADIFQKKMPWKGLWKIRHWTHKICLFCYKGDRKVIQEFIMMVKKGD